MPIIFILPNPELLKNFHVLFLSNWIFIIHFFFSLKKIAQCVQEGEIVVFLREYKALVWSSQQINQLKTLVFFLYFFIKCWVVVLDMKKSKSYVSLTCYAHVTLDKRPSLKKNDGTRSKEISKWRKRLTGCPSQVTFSDILKTSFFFFFKD